MLCIALTYDSLSILVLACTPNILLVASQKYFYNVWLTAYGLELSAKKITPNPNRTAKNYQYRYLRLSKFKKNFGLELFASRSKNTSTSNENYLLASLLIKSQLFYI